jgi:simple sugar transport system ATP-binding protein
VLLISEDLGELFSVCDRLLVMFKGRFVGEFSPSDISIKEVGHLMTGSEMSNGDHD